MQMLDMKNLVLTHYSTMMIIFFFVIYRTCNRNELMKQSLLPKVHAAIDKYDAR